MSRNLRETVFSTLPPHNVPPAKEVAPAPKVGDTAPSSAKLSFPRPKPTFIVFLRYCGDPFAEKIFKRLAALSDAHRGLCCVAISHASQAVTDAWVAQVGGAWETEVIVDEERDLYAAWGLGLSNTWHVYNPKALYSALSLGKNEGIWARATGGSTGASKEGEVSKTSAGPSGTVWQIGGAFAVDRAGVLKWAHVAKGMDDVPDFKEALQLLGMAP